MSSTHSGATGPVLRFGPFAADLASGQLHKHGVKLPLREQSFQVLVYLLTHPGQVVTRDDLRHQLWDEGVHVDFEKSLNTAVGRLRAVLGDSADRPRFIETLPKRGYRFIGEILEADIEPPATDSTIADVRPRSMRRAWMVGAALGVLALLVTLVALNVGGLRNRILHRPEPPHIESLAVLPLANVSGDPEQEYFADGMTDALITELAKISALKVISRTSVIRYKTTDKTAPQIAAELHVDALLEGTVEREGDQVRINVQLIHGPRDKHLWAETYQHELSGILALQSEVAQAVAQEVRASLTPEEHARLTRTQRVNPQAYEAYLKGRHYWEMRDRDGLQKALEYFEVSIRIDPSCALAYTGLADTYSILGDNKFLAPEQSFPKARAAARRALELDENLAEAHAAMALIVHAYDWDWPAGDREIDRAIQLNPGYASAHHWRALFLAERGRHSEALAEIRKAQSLDPLSRRINMNIGNVLYVARQYDHSIRELQKAVELFPDEVGALAGAYSAVGRHEEAIACTRRGLALRQEPPESDLGLARILALAGKRQEAKEILNLALRKQDKKYLPAPFVAQIYAALGEKDQAFAWLEKGYAERDSDMEWLLVLPGLDPLRSDSRFTDLLRKMKLEP